jgi:protein SCO1
MNTKRNMLSLMGGLALLPLMASAAQPKAAPAGPQANAFPNFVLETHDGKKMRFYDDMLKNKIVVINMLYTTCTSYCSESTRNLVQVQEVLGLRLGRDVFMYSLSLQPEQDRPEILNAYAKAHDLQPGWTLMTGKPGEMEQLRHRLGFFDIDPATDATPSSHTGLICIGHVERDRWQMMPSMSSPKMISRAILTI